MNALRLCARIANRERGERLYREIREWHLGNRHSYTVGCLGLRCHLNTYTAEQLRIVLAHCLVAFPRRTKAERINVLVDHLTSLNRETQ